MCYAVIRLQGNGEQIVAKRLNKYVESIWDIQMDRTGSENPHITLRGTRPAVRSAIENLERNIRQFPGLLCDLEGPEGDDDDDCTPDELRHMEGLLSGTSSL